MNLTNSGHMYDNFPKTTVWMATEFGTLLDRFPNRGKAFLKHSQLSEDRARRALRPHAAPACSFESFWHPLGRLKFAQLTPRQDGETILVNVGMAALFEKAPKTWGPILEATLLHELVHWGLLKSGSSTWAHSDSDDDPGFKFERETYGKVIEPNCAQKIALREVTNVWRPGTPGITSSYHIKYQCGVD